MPRPAHVTRPASPPSPAAAPVRVTLRRVPIADQRARAELVDLLAGMLERAAARARKG